MLDVILGLIGGLIVGLTSGISFMTVRHKKKVATILKTTAAASAPTPPPSVAIPTDKTKLKEFLSVYDKAGDFKFSDISYRLGAVNTCPFGLSEGYRMIDNKFVWDSVRIHTGVDRARGGAIKNIKDVVVCPFNFNRSEIVEYGDTSYGSLVILYNDDYNFCMRIAHMKPDKDIVPWSWEQFKKHAPFKQGWFIGTAGNYGDSDGAHTHTEILSLNNPSDVLEQILYERYGSNVLKEYSSDEILAYYKTRDYFKGKSDKDCLEHWAQLKQDKTITFMNKYLYRRIINGKHITYYNSWLLFNL